MFHARDRQVERSQFGTGTARPALGLHIATKIAIAHGGTLDFEPVRIGTECVRFRLWLPVVNGHPDHQ